MVAALFPEASRRGSAMMVGALLFEHSGSMLVQSGDRIGSEINKTTKYSNQIVQFTEIIHCQILYSLSHHY